MSLSNQCRGYHLIFGPLYFTCNSYSLSYYVCTLLQQLHLTIMCYLIHTVFSTLSFKSTGLLPICIIVPGPYAGGVQSNPPFGCCHTHLMRLMFAQAFLGVGQTAVLIVHVECVICKSHDHSHPRSELSTMAE